MEYLRKNSHGFTLIEMLVYLALLITISVVAVSFMLSSAEAVKHYRAERMLATTGGMIVDTIAEAIRNSDGVDTLTSTLGSSPGTLSVTSGASTTAFALSGGTITRTDDGAVVGALNPNSVLIGSLSFDHYSNSETELVRFTFTASTTVGSTTYGRTYRGASVLRGTYE